MPNLAAYNAGILHGKWIDARLELEEIQARVNTVLKNSPVCSAEELVIHDHEGFNGYNLSEYEGLNRQVPAQGINP